LNRVILRKAVVRLYNFNVDLLDIERGERREERGERREVDDDPLAYGDAVFPWLHLPMSVKRLCSLIALEVTEASRSECERDSFDIELIFLFDCCDYLEVSK
jgi:hypothetical protein